MNSDILYYRYIFVVAGLELFAISFILAKGKTIFASIICTIILIVGILNNISMVKENYSSSNQEPIKYIEDNIQEGDVITFKDIGCGSVVAENFMQYTQYYYNQGNWGIEEAYKAFGSQMTTYVKPDFIDINCKRRCWVIRYRLL